MSIGILFHAEAARIGINLRKHSSLPSVALYRCTPAPLYIVENARSVSRREMIESLQGRARIYLLSSYLCNVSCSLAISRTRPTQRSARCITC